MSRTKFHELMIEYGLYTHVSDEARQGLTRGETVRGIETDIGLEVTNIGKSSFLGGVINRLSFEPVAYSFVSTYNVNVVIPPLEPHEKKDVIMTEFVVAFEGSAWLVLQMNANDGVPIKTHQSKGGLVGTNEWRNSIYILSKEMFNIYQLVRRIEKQTRPKKA